MQAKHSCTTDNINVHLHSRQKFNEVREDQLNTNHIEKQANEKTL